MQSGQLGGRGRLSASSYEALSLSVPLCLFIFPSQVLQLGIMLHSLVIGFTLALASGSDFESLATAISFHQLFEGLSLGIRIAALPTHPQQSSLNWLRPLLALLFALTTPAGILSGLIVFDAGHRGGGVGAKVAEGVLSAVSAGMLIYAACVEMLAADFVLDPTLWRASKGRQVLALASVGLGAAGMVLLECVCFPPLLCEKSAQCVSWTLRTPDLLGVKNTGCKR